LLIDFSIEIFQTFHHHILIKNSYLKNRVKRFVQQGASYCDTLTLFIPLLLLTLSLIWISILNSVAANAQQTQGSPIGIKITSPSAGQNIPISTQNGSTVSNLTVSGTSTDNNNTDCQVSVIVNGIKPYQPAIALGSDGKDDYSKWNFSLTPQYHAIIKEGPSNKITAKLACSPNLVKWYSLNVTGITSSSSLSSRNVVSPHLVRTPNNLTAITTNRVNDKPASNTSMINITSPAPHQEIPIGSKITIYGTSKANFQMDCKVYTKKNNLPFQNATATGSKGANDYSTWKSTYADDEGLITSGDTNNLTAMLSCYKNQNTTSDHMSTIKSGKQLTAYANVNIIGINKAPVAVAKIEDKKVNEGEKVILNGAGSKDPNGDSLTYLWKQTGGFPDDLDIAGSNKAKAKITIPEDLIKDTKFTFELTVIDPYGERSTDSVFVVAIGNTKPVADAGNDKKAVRGDEVTLDGTHSHDRDPRGKIISYVWKGTGGNNKPIYLQNPDQPVTTFTVPLVQKDTTFEFALTVTDDEGAKDQDKVNVEVKGNTKPVADAGNDKKAVRGDEVTLDGTHSHDLDKTGRIVSYKWDQIGGGVNVELQNPDQPVTTFTVPLVQKDTTFEFALTVTDDEGAKDQDKVKVQVNAPLSLSPIKNLEQALSGIEVPPLP
jgi:K319L-like, PKD domain